MLPPAAINVEVLVDHHLKISFDNGEIKIFDITPYIQENWYSELNDSAYFNTVTTNGFSIEWAHGQDISTIKQDVSTLKEDVSKLKNDVSKIGVTLEHQIEPKISALFDARDVSLQSDEFIMQGVKEVKEDISHLEKAVIRNTADIVDLKDYRKEN